MYSLKFLISQPATTLIVVSKMDVYNQNISSFLAQFGLEQTQENFEQLAKLTNKECELLLKSAGIKGVVQERVKQYSSLEKKLEDMKLDDEFRS